MRNLKIIHAVHITFALLTVFLFSVTLIANNNNNNNKKKKLDRDAMWSLLCSVKSKVTTAAQTEKKILFKENTFFLRVDLCKKIFFV